MEESILMGVGSVSLVMPEPNGWQVRHEVVEIEEGVEELRLGLRRSEAAPYPRFSLEFSVPEEDIVCRWHANALFDKTMPPEWAGTFTSQLADGAPVYSLVGGKGNSWLTVAVSEALRKLVFTVGLREFTFNITNRVEFFTQEEAPATSYEVTMRLDRRVRDFEFCVQDAFSQFGTAWGMAPAAVPESGLHPWYSSWYGFHKDMTAAQLEEECGQAKDLGMDGIIVDDGWQCDIDDGPYDYCGDWQVARTKIPNMAEHVQRVHDLGMKYMLWFSVPFIGFKSQNHGRFKGMYLYDNHRLGASVLDPRFPEVRQWLISLYLKALCEWKLDGFKLDFIDSFQVPEGEADPAVAEDYGGRDLKSVPLATDLLLKQVMEHLRAEKPDVLIEFRQHYMGPAVRTYGNLLRAGDCPGDYVRNRVATVDLKLSSGTTAVHGDMLGWQGAGGSEAASRQLLSVLFAVPQVSVVLDGIPEEHKRRIKRHLAFVSEHRDTLLKGELQASHPELNYPVVRSEGEREAITCCYSENQVVMCTALAEGKREIVINGTETETLALKLPAEVTATVLDADGETLSEGKVCDGLRELSVPAYGRVILTAIEA